MGEEEVKPQITRNDANKIFRKEELLTEQRYRRMEDQKPGPGLACNLGFAKEKRLEPKVKKDFQNCLSWETWRAN